MRRARIAVLLAALLPAVALAQPGPYVGVSGGQSRTSDDLASNREDTLANASAIRSDFDADAGGWKLFAGYRFTPWLAAEAGYADLGKSRLSATMLGGTPGLPAAFDLHRKVNGYGIDVVVGAPIGERFAVFARGGAYRMRVEADVALDGNIVFPDTAERSRTVKHDSTVGHFGVGGEWAFAPHAALRLEWERFLDAGKSFEVGETGGTGKADTDLYTVGFVYRFR